MGTMNSIWNFQWIRARSETEGIWFGKLPIVFLGDARHVIEQGFIVNDMQLLGHFYSL